MASLNQGVIERIPLLLPPLAEQRAIADTLGTLDDKIELNRRMNETLEAMAQALFKSWFVDFDPVRAKSECRDPGLPEPIAIETAQVIEELIQLAMDMREAALRGEKLGLSDDELAFYDALETNDSAVQVLGDETLKTIARELVETVRKNVTIDWTIRENVRAQLRVYVKRILRKYGYPPDKAEKATRTVLEQAEVLSEAWAIG